MQKHGSSLDEDRNQAHAALEGLRQTRSAVLSTEGHTWRGACLASATQEGPQEEGTFELGPTEGGGTAL